MTKKRKQKNQDWDEWEDEPDARDLQPDVEVAHVGLRDFIVPAKVEAFINSYRPCNEFDMGYESFTDAELREFFKAYVCGLGDPLALYIDDLKTAGFRMTVSMVTGEPTIFVVRKD